MPEAAIPATGARTRDLARAWPSAYPVDVDGWAVVIGISSYRDRVLNLDYAADDAREFHRVLKASTAGRFVDERIRLLLDGQATTPAVTDALRSFLKKPAPEDLVVLYIACHGSPDPDRPQNLYLLTHDTDRANVAGTAVPMREIESALRDNLLAERVVILADTCHSAAIGVDARRRGVPDEAEAINRYLEGVSRARGGTALLTSAEANEVSLEGDMWGGGHGVFTHFLLEGMQGAAAGDPRRGVVRVGELFEYVRDQVMRATNGAQHPAIGQSMFDRELPITVTGELPAAQRRELGGRLFELARRLDDPYAYRAAAAVVREAATGTSVARDDAVLLAGTALLAGGDAAAAAELLTSVTKEGARSGSVCFTRGVAELRAGRPAEARAAFTQMPADHPRALWAHGIVDWIDAAGCAPRAYALVIGIDDYQRVGAPNLRSAVGDARLVAEALAANHSVSDTTLLLDADATKANILAAFRHLGRDGLELGDSVFVYYAGHAYSGDSESFLVPADANADGQNVITVVELHALMEGLAPAIRTIVLDCDPNTRFMEFADGGGDYNALFAASPGQHSYEAATTEGGAFARALADVLAALPPTASPADLHRLTAERLREDMKPQMQAPWLSGPAEGSPRADREDPFALWELAVRRAYRRDTPESLRQRLETALVGPEGNDPELLASLGRGLLVHGDHASADRALRLALARKVPDRLATLVDLTAAQLTLQRFDQAAKSVRRLAAELGARDSEATELAEALEAHTAEPRRALVVGVDDYVRISGGAGAGAGARDAAAIMREVLVDRCGFPRSGVRMLLDGKATRAAIERALRELADATGTGHAVVYFAGLGVTDGGSWRVLPADTDPDLIITAGDLELLPVNKAATVTVVLDANWIDGVFDDPGSFGWPALGPPSEPDRILLVGQGPIGVLTAALARRLRETSPLDVAVEDLFRLDLSADSDAPFKQYPYVKITGRYDRALFSSALESGWASGTVAALGRAPLYETEAALQELSERLQGANPDVHLWLGWARVLLASEAAAIASFDRALDQRVGPFPEAHFHLGRVLSEGGRDQARAVSELRLAIQQDPEYPATYYHLGQAIRALVERETLAEAEQSFRGYLERGAPVGHAKEVRDFLRSRTTRPAVSR